METWGAESGGRNSKCKGPEAAPLEKCQGSQCSGSRVSRGRAPEVRSWGKEDSQRRTLAVDLEWSGSHARLL